MNDLVKKKEKKQNILIVLGLIVLIGMIGGLTFAFFNYTRTGQANTLRVGEINFSSDYDSVQIDNVFPIDKTNVSTDTDNVMTVNVNIEGSTTYEKGIYYEVKAEDVHLTVNGKNVPIGINVTSSNLNNVTLTSYEDGKILTNNSVFAEGRILKSDLANNIDNSVDGTITIKAYLDKDRIAVTDTIENGNIVVTGYNNGTINSWIGGRVVLTTAEWNSLSNTPLSFKVRVEAIENDVSTLVDGATFIGKVKKLANPNLSGTINPMTPDNNITTFQRVTEKPNTTGFTEDNVISTIDSAYPIYAWYENGVIKYYSESENIKANKSMRGMFMFLKALEDIGDLGSLDTTNVTLMSSLLRGCTKMSSWSFLFNWNVSNVTSMAYMFNGCTGITSLNSLSNWNVSNVTDMFQMFYNCPGITSLNGLSNWNVSKVENMQAMFMGCRQITSLNPLSNWNVSNVTNMGSMFNECEALNNVSGISNWNITNVNNFSFMFRAVSLYPTFTKRAGTWDSEGTFTPTPSNP